MRLSIALLVFSLVALAPAASASSFHFNQISIISSAQADDAPAPAVSGSPSLAEKAGEIGDKIGAVADKIPMDNTVIMVISLIVGFGYDLIRRKWPTKNPASLWGDVKAVIGGFSKILLGLSKVVDKLNEFGDKVFGQNQK